MKKLQRISSVVLATLVASTTFSAHSQSATTAQLGQVSAPTAEVSAPTTTSNNLPETNPGTWHARQGAYFIKKWGVDIVDVRRSASGEMLAFRYVVLDPEKARVLNDKASSAFLIDEKTGVKLMVPNMEKTGALRTTVTQKPSHMYWMIFANTGRVVNAGSRVDVKIGDFRADGLTVISK
jgi:hypothetical protein